MPDAVDEAGKVEREHRCADSATAPAHANATTLATTVLSRATMRRVLFIEPPGREEERFSAVEEERSYEQDRRRQKHTTCCVVVSVETILLTRGPPTRWNNSHGTEAITNTSSLRDENGISVARLEENPRFIATILTQGPLSRPTESMFTESLRRG